MRTMPSRLNNLLPEAYVLEDIANANHFIASTSGRKHTAPVSKRSSNRHVYRTAGAHGTFAIPQMLYIHLMM